MKLTFYISEIKILQMDVDLENKRARATYTGSERALKPLLLPNQRNYAGLESRLQFMMDSKKKLPELLDEIRTEGIHIDFHRNLNINIVVE